MYVCENVYDVAQENNDREQLYYVNDIEYFEQHSDMIKGYKTIEPNCDSWLPWQWKQVYELKPKLLSDFQIQYVESYGRLGIDRYTIDDRSIHDVITRLKPRIEKYSTIQTA
ncbi:hypothetical protein [uncultured Ruminococcus sp.]|uniref:hypothetical protein n=1 Tax=uncultured Ruminococcus sp. TaxID=165186 RepID=UPI0025FFC70B|nr:hypothetical protein [uncultured Ruminococcus sp.]